jgi:hypothetical protein
VTFLFCEIRESGARKCPALSLADRRRRTIQSVSSVPQPKAKREGVLLQMSVEIATQVPRFGALV